MSVCEHLRIGERQGQPKRRIGPEVTGKDAWILIWTVLGVTFHASLPFCGFTPIT